MLTGKLPQPVLEGHKVTLAPLGEEHLARSLEWVNDPHIMSTVLRVTPVSWSDQRAWHQSLQSNPSRMVYAILWREGGTHIGNTGLYHLDMLHRRGEFWIFLGDPSYRGLGAASEAMTLLERHAFETLGLERLYLHVGVDNLPARSLYTRHNFKEEGILRRHYIIGGKPVDVAVMSLLRQEYDHKQRPQQG
ncbi:MAG: GNAT family N-acetyltransferase [Thermodesulfobacteriota bacterium]